jgi:hypothetical protein
VVSEVVFAEEDQAALEAKATARLSRVERGELTPQAGMGTIEEWRLDLCAHRLLLVPSTREWLYYDRAHDTWEPTGYLAGEVRFGVNGDTLGVKRIRAAAFCGACGAPAQPGDRFCGVCGKAYS